MSVRLTADEAWSVLEAAHTSILTTLRADGMPITLPRDANGTDGSRTASNRR